MLTFEQFVSEGIVEGPVAILPGGFKPPHKGHFSALLHLIEQGARAAIVYIGAPCRDNVTCDQSKQIWEIYSKHVKIPVDIEIVPNPVRAVYEFTDKNPDIHTIIGAGEEDMKRWSYFEKNADKFPNVQLVAIPPQFGRISGSDTRANLCGDSPELNFIPADLPCNDVADIAQILGVAI